MGDDVQQQVANEVEHQPTCPNDIIMDIYPGLTIYLSFYFTLIDTTIKGHFSSNSSLLDNVSDYRLPDKYLSNFYRNHHHQLKRNTQNVKMDVKIYIFKNKN